MGPLVSLPWQAYCAEMVCFDYHKFCKGQSTQANLEGVFLPLVNSFFSTHSWFVENNGETLRYVGSHDPPFDII